MNANSSATLIVTADDRLEADLIRLAAAAGVTPETARDPVAAARGWSSAAMVLVGADLVADVARMRPARRDGAFLVGTALRDQHFRDALGCGAEGAVRLPEDEDWLVQLLTDVGDGTPVPALVVGVVGGAGGVGASTFAVALALACAGSLPTCLVDADALGAGVDHILGLDTSVGVRWDVLLASTGRLSGRSIREALPKRDGLSVLAWPQDRLPLARDGAAREVLSAVERGFSVVVVDLARQPDLLTEEVLLRCGLVLVVTTTTVPVQVATARIVQRLRGTETALVVRRRPGGLDAEEVSRFLGRPVIATMADQRGLDEDVGLGAGPMRRARGTLARAAARTADQVTARLRPESLG